MFLLFSTVFSASDISFFTTPEYYKVLSEIAPIVEEENEYITFKEEEKESLSIFNTLWNATCNKIHSIVAEKEPEKKEQILPELQDPEELHKRVNSGEGTPLEEDMGYVADEDDECFEQDSMDPEDPPKKLFTPYQKIKIHRKLRARTDNAHTLIDRLYDTQLLKNAIPFFTPKPSWDLGLRSVGVRSIMNIKVPVSNGILKDITNVTDLNTHTRFQFHFTKDDNHMIETLCQRKMNHTHTFSENDPYIIMEPKTIFKNVMNLDLTKLQKELSEIYEKKYTVLTKIYESPSMLERDQKIIISSVQATEFDPSVFVILSVFE